MYRVFEREEVIKRMNGKFGEKTATRLIDGFLFLAKLINEEAGDMGDDVLYYSRQYNALKTLGKVIGLTDDEINKFINGNAVYDFYAPQLYTKEEYIRYIDSLDDTDKKEIEERWNMKFEDISNHYKNATKNLL